MRHGLAGTVTAWDDLALEKITALISRKRVDGDRQTLAQVYLKRGALVPLHAHEGEQMIYVLDGRLKLRVAGEDVTVRVGEVVCIPPQARHQIEALADTFALEVRGRTPHRTNAGDGGRRPPASAPRHAGSPWSDA